MMKRAILPVLTVCLAWTVSVQAQSFTLAPQGVVGLSNPRASANVAMHVLRKRVESVDWTESTFEEVLDWLRDQSDGRLNIIARWNALGVESIGPESLVTLQLNNTTVAEVLNETMNQLSEDGEAQYRGIGNAIQISTKTDFGRKLYFRVYNVTDILFRVRDFGQESPKIDLQNVGGRGGGGGGGGGGQSIFQGGGGQGQQQGGRQAEQELDENLEDLKDLIEQIIMPSSWSTSGGQGQIGIFNQSLIVYNTIEVHELLSGSFTMGG